MSRIQTVSLFAVLFGFAAWSHAADPVPGPAWPSARSESIPLPPPGAAPTSPLSGNSSSPHLGQTLTTIVGALAVCLGLFFLFVWLTKRHAPRGSSQLPNEVVESLGRMALSNRQQLQLLRVGHKLVLINVTPTGAEALTEVTDRAEVDRLVGLCQQNRATSVTNSFREVLTHYESEPAGKGFLGELRQSDWELATRVGNKRPTRQEELDG